MSMLRVVPWDAEARMTALDRTFGDALEGVAAQLERHTIRASEISYRAVVGSIAVGDPAAEIVEAVEGHGNGGLAALGSHGSGLGHRLVLGSVSTKVLHALHGSVLIVPPPRSVATTP
jgi:nucleotide-binding universal stress UspA family protein